jgi:DNA-binding transcriptional MerR regulator
MFTIGVLSHRARVKIETIRYYERIDLIPRPDRTESGRRLYGPEDVQQLSFIRHARELGFEVAAIRAMLGLREMPDASCEQVSRISQNQLAAVNDRIARLIKLKEELIRMIDSCGNGKVADCRIIEVLADYSSPSDPADENSGL